MQAYLTYDEAKVLWKEATEYIKNDTEKALSLLNNTLTKIDPENEISKAEIYYILSRTYLRLGDYADALSYARKSNSIYVGIKNLTGLGQTNSVMGIIHHMLGNLPEAISYFNHSLDAAIKLDSNQGRVANYMNIASIYIEMEEYNQAMKYFDDTLHFSNKEDTYRQALIYGNIGELHNRMGNHQQGIETLRKAFSFSAKVNDTSGMVNHLGSLGNALFSMKEYESALDHYLKANELASKNKYKREFAVGLMSLGKVYSAMGQSDLALKHLNDALNLSKEMGSSLRELHAHENLANFYSKIKNWEKAHHHLSRQYEIDKKLKVDELKKRTLDLETQREIEIKERETKIERIKNIELKKAYEELKKAQDKIVEQERMVTLGKVSMEIAHEIQNPLNFVNNLSEVNSEILDDLIEDLKKSGKDQNLLEELVEMKTNSKSVAEHGKRVATIVSQLIQKAREAETAFGEKSS